MSTQDLIDKIINTKDIQNEYRGYVGSMKKAHAITYELMDRLGIEKATERGITTYKYGRKIHLSEFRHTKLNMLYDGDTKRITITF